MVIAIIAGILFVTLALVFIGSYLVVHRSNREKDTEEIAKIALSGKYSVAFCPVADSLAKKKPGLTELEGWLNSQGIDEEQKKKLLENWQKSINQSIKTVNDGDMNGITTYKIDLGPKDKDICNFLHPDHFITREQINRNAEILPPYYFGSDSVVAPKLPNDKGGWQSLLPKDGGYEVPDWHRIV